MGRKFTIRLWCLCFALTLGFSLTATWQTSSARTSEKGGSKMGIQLTGSAFLEGAPIPGKYTCDGQDISPPLKWKNVPQGTRSIALICDDPDAPVGTWVHWVLYGLPGSVTELPEGVPNTTNLPNGAKQGLNDFGRIGYGGPCPPGKSAHRYFFKLYALDTELSLPPKATKKDLLRAMEGHILAEGQLMGTYKRK
jgi:Raf kinase inhibitor-like YbhB/YbcL family protein